MKTYCEKERWAIILAGGEGRRMSNYVLSRYGEHRPKQYCSFTGKHSMFQHTMKRATAAVGNLRVVTVIGQGHFRYIDPQTTPGIVVEQPQNYGTAPGIFLPLSYVMAYDPEATVLIFPSDHFISPNHLFVAIMKNAATLAEQLEDHLVLLAAVANRPETEYGWIQPGETVGNYEDAAKVLHFHEKPDTAKARQFYKAGYFWNTLNIAVKAKTLWALGWNLHPEMMVGFQALKSVIGTPDEALILSKIYQDMGAIDFSKDILEQVVEQTLVLPMKDIQWSDWGRPERIQETLGRWITPTLPRNPINSMVLG